MRSRKFSGLAAPEPKKKGIVEFLGYGKYDLSFSNDEVTQKQYVHQTSENGVTTSHSLFPYDKEDYLFSSKSEFEQNMNRLLNEPIKDFIRKA